MLTARTVIATTLAALPFFAALVSHGRSQPTLLSIPDGSRPALAFQQYAVDLGLINPAPEVRATFVFWNRSSRSVTINELTPSCGCLSPRLEQKTYRPGEVGKIVLRMQPATESPGQKEYFVDVKYDDSEPRTTRLTFRLQLPEHQLTVSPRGLIFYQLNGQPSIQELHVADTRGNKVRVTEAVCPSPLVKLDIKSGGVSESGVSEEIVIVHVRGDVPQGKQTALVTIKTDANDVPEVRIPLLIYGPDANPRSKAGERSNSADE